jgi:chitosanase
VVDLSGPVGADIAQQIVCSAENSSLDWRAQYGYIEDIGDGRGFTGGLIGFCSGTGDMLEVVERCAADSRGSALARFVPALRRVDGSDSHDGLGRAFEAAWRQAADDPAFRRAQHAVLDEQYRWPAVEQARADGLRGLGQLVYYDALVMHGPGEDEESFGGIRRAAVTTSRPPAQGGDERYYLSAFLDARRRVMHMEEAHADTSRLDTAQQWWLDAGNLDLDLPLHWQVYGDDYAITSPTPGIDPGPSQRRHPDRDPEDGAHDLLGGLGSLVTHAAETIRRWTGR